jgi:siroheme synthase (precorrin-2 oxidase/ferrochelatase)
METAEVFGFGSFFRASGSYRDIDLLVLHRSTEAASCGLAVHIKRHLIKAIPLAHITMLAYSEEQDMRFVEQSVARFLSIIHEDKFREDCDALALQVNRWAALATLRQRSIPATLCYERNRPHRFNYCSRMT